MWNSRFFPENTMVWKQVVENRGIDPRTSRMLSERSTIWASSPAAISEITIEVILYLIFAFEICRKRMARWILPLIHEFSCRIHGNSLQTNPPSQISFIVKTLSEVGFEPTPTFVDQNAPVRKSFTLESGALDRSAILTCHSWKKNKNLNAKKRKTEKSYFDVK